MFYNPVLSLLLLDKEWWKGMWLTGQAWCKQGIKTPTDVNPIYKHMKCLAHCFNSLKVLKQFQTMLLYTSKPKLMKPHYHVTYT